MTSPSLYPGLSGDEVAVLRHQLCQLGFEVGDGDGTFGPAMFQAVLAVDGLTS